MAGENYLVMAPIFVISLIFVLRKFIELHRSVYFILAFSFFMYWFFLIFFYDWGTDYPGFALWSLPALVLVGLGGRNANAIKQKS